MNSTPSRTMWGIIENGMRAKKMRRKDLARLVGVHPNTITKDSQEPDRIPQGRLWLYFEAIGISAGTVVKFAASECM